MREIYKVNVSELNQFLETIRTAKNNLNNNSYANFKKSYIYISNNPKISEIKNNLSKKYEKIIDDYNAIIKWLSEYIDDVEKLEKTLSTGTNFVNDVETRNYVNKILANSNVSIPKAHSGKIIRMKIAKYGEDFYNHIVSLNNEEKGKQINRTANYGQVSSDKGEQRKSPSGYAKVQGLSNVPTYSRDWRDKKTSSTANNMLNNLNNISVLQYMPKEEKKDPELQKIMDQYGEETAVQFLLVTSFEDRINELNGLIETFEKKKKEAQDEYNKIYIEYEAEKRKYEHNKNYNFNYNKPNKLRELEVKELKAREELNKVINEIELSDYDNYKDELAENKYYLKETKKNLEISKYASILNSDKIAWEYEGYSRTFAEEYQNYLKTMKDEKKPDICKYMTEEQANIYCFYYHYMDREHPDLIGTSDDFIKIIEDDINKAKGAEAAAKWIENYEKYKANPNDTISFKNLKGFITQGSLTVGKGFFDGLDSFFDGLKNAVDWNDKISADDYEKMIIAQYIINEGIYDDAYKLSSSFGNMLPSIVASAVVSAIATPAAGAEVAAKLAPIVGSATMGVSTFGNAIHEAKVNGHSTASSFMYGLLAGGSEAIVGYFVGKMPFLSKGKDAVSMTMKQTAKEYIKDLLSEGLEELTQEVFDAVFRNICLGEEIDFDSLPTDMRDSFCMGVLMSYALSGGPYKTARFVIDGIEYNIKLSDLADQLYTNGHLNKNLTKADIKNIIKNGGSASVREISNMMNEYNSLMSTISKNEYDIFKLSNNSNTSILYNNDNYVKFKRIAELETAFKEAGVNYNYKFQTDTNANTNTNTNTNTNNVVEMPNINNKNNFSDIFSDFMNNNAGAVNLDVLAEIPRGIIKYGKKLYGIITGKKDNSGITDYYEMPYKNSDKVQRKYIKKWNSDFKIDKNTGNQIESIFSDSDYVYGIHRTANDDIANDIYYDGLMLTGHSTNGTDESEVNLMSNISFESDNRTEWQNAKLFMDICSSSSYKYASYNHTGYGMIIKIPKEYAIFGDSGTVIGFKNINDLVDFSSSTPVLKSEYIVGKVEVKNNNIIPSKNTEFKDENFTPARFTEEEVKFKQERLSEIQKEIESNPNLKMWIDRIEGVENVDFKEMESIPDEYGQLWAEKKEIEHDLENFKEYGYKGAKSKVEEGKAKFTETEISNKVNRYNEIIDELDTNPDYKYWMDEIEKGHAIAPTEEFLKLREERYQLELDIKNSQEYGFRIDESNNSVEISKNNKSIENVKNLNNNVIQVNTYQYINGLNSLSVEHPKYSSQINELTEKIKNKNIITSSDIAEFNKILNDIINNDWNYGFESENYDIYKSDFKAALTRSSNVNKFELQEDGTYNIFDYDIEISISEDITSYLLSNNIDFSNINIELINYINTKNAEVISEYSKYKVNNFNGDRKYMYEHTDYVCDGFVQLLNSNYLSDSDKMIIYEKGTELSRISNEIKKIKAETTNGMTKDQYIELNSKYNELVNLENEISYYNGKAWENYYNSTDAVLVHTFSSGAFSIEDFRGPKICTSLMVNNNTTLAYGNTGMEFRPNIDNIDTFCKGDAGSWDFDNSEFTRIALQYKSLSRQKTDTNIWYEGGDHTKIYPPETIQNSIQKQKEKGSYTEIVLINDGNVKPYKYFYTDKATKQEIQAIMKLAKKDNIPVEMINSITYERTPVNY